MSTECFRTSELPKTQFLYLHSELKYGSDMKLTVNVRYHIATIRKWNFCRKNNDMDHFLNGNYRLRLFMNSYQAHTRWYGVPY